MWYAKTGMEGASQNPQSKTGLSYFKSISKIIFIALIPAVITLIAFTIFPKNFSRTLSSYTLRCGQKTLTNCTEEQLKPQDLYSLKVDAASAFAKYQDAKPDLCYTTNIAPTGKRMPVQKLNLAENSLYGGCIKDAYNLYKKKSEFIFFIDGQFTGQKLQAKAYLTAGDNKTVEEKIKNGVEIFNF